MAATTSIAPTAGWAKLKAARPLRATLRAAARSFLDIGLPPLCPACWSKLNFITRPYCERLGIPFAYDPGPGILSMEAIANPPAYGRARAAVRFDDVARA